MTKETWISQLSEDWAAGSSRRVGRVVCEHVDARRLGQVLASIVREFSSTVSDLELEPEVLNLVSHELNWPQACEAFHQIRSKTLHLEMKGQSGSRDSALLGFQENVAKHLCNVSSNRNQYDGDSGKWAVICLVELLEYLSTNEADWIRDAFMVELTIH